MDSLFDVITDIDLKLQELGWTEVAQHGNRKDVIVVEQRLIAWGVEALVRSGRDRSTVLEMLQRCRQDKQWWLLRQMLPEAALVSLDRKLTTFLQDHANRPRPISVELGGNLSGSQVVCELDMPELRPTLSDGGGESGGFHQSYLRTDASRSRLGQPDGNEHDLLPSATVHLDDGASGSKPPEQLAGQSQGSLRALPSQSRSPLPLAKSRSKTGAAGSVAAGDLKCAYCDAPATKLCDGKTGEGTCDRPMCNGCVAKQSSYIACSRGKGGRRGHAGTIDYCRDCAALIGGKSLVAAIVEQVEGGQDATA